MSVSYDLFTEAFFEKITEYDFIKFDERDVTSTVDGYMKRALSYFKKVCNYDFFTTADDLIREFDVDVPDEHLDELAEIISEGMLVQWLKKYVNRQEILESIVNTRDFTQHSPAELLLRVGNAYAEAKKNFTQLIREYSYNHGDLTGLHL